MHKYGHYGTALIVYAPVGFLILAAGFTDVALAGAAVVVGGAMLPDVDMKLPFVKHRGPTHTVGFALAVGVTLALLGTLVGSGTGALAALALGLFGFVVGSLTVGAHLLADALTPMGIRPLEPRDDREVCLDVTRASNPLANYALLAVGAILAGLAFLLGTGVATALGT